MFRALLLAVALAIGAPAFAQDARPAGSPASTASPIGTTLLDDRHYTNSNGHVVHGPTRTPNGQAPAGTPDVPAALDPPADQTRYLEARATGVQIYVCTARTDGGYQWVFKAPEATLVDAVGKTIATHYAGPTWEANDGSKVVGELKAKDPGPLPTAIPWLLLTAKSNTGAGVFNAARSIQRVHTTGGLPPPADTCVAASVNHVARVAYTATYYFFRAP